MNKEKEMELLKQAKQWFEKEYRISPEQAGFCFMKVWHKKIVFKTMPTVVFAPSAQEGRAFMLTQNKILFMIRCFCLLPLLLVVAGAVAWHMASFVPLIILLAICVWMFIYCFVVAKKEKQMEKLYRNKIVLYFP